MKNTACSRAARRFAFAVGAVGISILCSAALLCCVAPDRALTGIKTLLFSGFSSPESVKRVLLYWPLLILTGLSVGVGRKAGFVNTGAPGQFTIGALLALTGAMLFSLPWWACLLISFLGGALWGAVAGLLKTKLQVNEVLSTVMLNLVALYLTQWVWTDALEGREAVFSSNAALPVITVGGCVFSIGLFLASFFCLVFWIVFRFRVWGYELRAGGDNPEAAKRAGMPVSKNALLAACLSGGLSGLAGAVCFLSGMTDTALSELSTVLGYAGLPVAWLCFSNPLGTMLTSLFAACALAGRENLPAEFPGEIAYVLLAVAALAEAVMQKNRKSESESCL